MIRCAGCNRPTGGTTFGCCGRGWCHACYQPHLAHILAAHGLAGSKAYIDQVLASPGHEIVGITRRGYGRPPWDAPVNSPSPWLFPVLVVAIIAVVLGALELAEWLAGRWGA